MLKQTLAATDVAGAASGPSRRAVVAAGVWAVPVIMTATASPAFAASGTLTLANRDLEKIARGINVHVGLNNGTGTDAKARITVTLVSGKTSVSDTKPLTVPANGYAQIYPWKFENLEVGRTYTGSITVKAPGFTKISNHATEPASQEVDQYR